MRRAGLLESSLVRRPKYSPRALAMKRTSILERIADWLFKRSKERADMIDEINCLRSELSEHERHSGSDDRRIELLETERDRLIRKIKRVSAIVSGP